VFIQDQDQDTDTWGFCLSHHSKTQ